MVILWNFIMNTNYVYFFIVKCREASLYPSQNTSTV